MTIKTDFLVIGSGIGGLSFALKTARALPDKTVIVLCKSKARETNTRYAQGGIAAADTHKTHSVKSHIKDTLRAGGRLCNKKVVELVVKESAARLAELGELGVDFDRTRSGSYDMAREGGHSESRIFHKGDYTGLEIEKKLLACVRKMPNIRLLENTMAIDLITTKNLAGASSVGKTCYGVFALLSNGGVAAIESKITLLATGGVGQIFEHTTNSIVATGDGIAMAARAGAKIRHMEFIQFHPTALYSIKGQDNFLISEAVRGLGGILRTAAGETFMQKYALEKDLATRDIVSRAIQTEITKQNVPFVFLDCRHIPKKEFVSHFPTITTKCINLGINPADTMIPVAPSAHYCCGGIATDIHGRTTVKNLYACGECASTGLHGSNRLASNSLLEALVYAHRAATHASEVIRGKQTASIHTIRVPVYRTSERNVESELALLKKAMSSSIGATTSNVQIEAGLRTIKELNKEFGRALTVEINPHIIELRNMIKVAMLILTSARLRVSNTGVYYNTDLAGKKGNMTRIAPKHDLGHVNTSFLQ